MYNFKMAFINIDFGKISMKQLKAIVRKATDQFNLYYFHRTNRKYLITKININVNNKPELVVRLNLHPQSPLPEGQEGKNLAQFSRFLLECGLEDYQKNKANRRVLKRLK